MKETNTEKKPILLQPIIYINTNGGNVLYADNNSNIYERCAIMHGNNGTQNIADRNSIINNGDNCAFSDAGTMYYNNNGAMNMGENSGEMKVNAGSTDVQILELKTQIEMLQIQVQKLCKLLENKQ